MQWQLTGGVSVYDGSCLAPQCACVKGMYVDVDVYVYVHVYVSVFCTFVCVCVCLAAAAAAVPRNVRTT